MIFELLNRLLNARWGSPEGPWEVKVEGQQLYVIHGPDGPLATIWTHHPFMPGLLVAAEVLASWLTLPAESQIKQDRLDWRKTMQVSYERLWNLGNYENERIGAVLVVEPGETPAEAYKRAEALVDAEHDRREQARGKVQDLWGDVHVLEARKAQAELAQSRLQNQLQTLADRVRALLGYAGEHDLNIIPPRYIQDILDKYPACTTTDPSALAEQVKPEDMNSSGHDSERSE